MLTLTLDQVRALLLAAQGLLQPPTTPANKTDLLDAIRRMGALQIDTIHVIARSPYLVLWSRLGAYQPSWLDQLLAEGAIFEYWSHAACFLPIEAFATYRARMLAARQPEGNWRSWIGDNPAVLDRVLAHVREHGPVRSADFGRASCGGPWWDWKPEKAALELLFDQGHLMIARRERFQRVYDLQERVLPEWDESRALSAAAVRQRHASEAVRALGMAPARWVADYFRIKKTGVPQLLDQLVANGELLPVTVVGWDTPAYLHPSQRDLAEQAAAGALIPQHTTLLSPFDPVVWDRERALELYNFHYRIEVYTPAAQRTYGYFTLPILHHGRLVGRLDPKAHRQQGCFEVKAIHLEPDVVLDEAFVHGLATALQECANWHGTPELTFGTSDPPALVPALQARLKHV
ncbi:MAG: winged helix-turn-helix domain-containing protein [Oscillochloridaceae bacterium umkhey_bin13]